MRWTQPLAVFDHELRPNPGKGLQEPDPVMPSGAAARIIGLVDKCANLLERLEMFGVLAQGKFDLGLQRRPSASLKYVSAWALPQRR